MDTANEILRALGRIEGELVEIRKLSERVSKLEVCDCGQKASETGKCTKNSIPSSPTLFATSLGFGFS